MEEEERGEEERGEEERWMDISRIKTRENRQTPNLKSVNWMVMNVSLWCVSESCEGVSVIKAHCQRILDSLESLWVGQTEDRLLSTNERDSSSVGPLFSLRCDSTRTLQNRTSACHRAPGKGRDRLEREKERGRVTKGQEN